MNQKNQKTGNSSAEVVVWDVDIEEEEPSPGKRNPDSGIYKYGNEGKYKGADSKHW